MNIISNSIWNSVSSSTARKLWCAWVLSDSMLAGGHKSTVRDLWAGWLNWSVESFYQMVQASAYWNGHLWYGTFHPSNGHSDFECHWQPHWWQRNKKLYLLLFNEKPKAWKAVSHFVWDVWDVWEKEFTQEKWVNQIMSIYNSYFD